MDQLADLLASDARRQAHPRHRRPDARADRPGAGDRQPLVRPAGVCDCRRGRRGWRAGDAGRRAGRARNAAGRRPRRRRDRRADGECRLRRASRRCRDPRRRRRRLARRALADQAQEGRRPAAAALRADPRHPRRARRERRSARACSSASPPKPRMSSSRRSPSGRPSAPTGSSPTTFRATSWAATATACTWSPPTGVEDWPEASQGRSRAAADRADRRGARLIGSRLIDMQDWSDSKFERRSTMEVKMKSFLLRRCSSLCMAALPLAAGQASTPRPATGATCPHCIARQRHHHQSKNVMHARCDEIATKHECALPGYRRHQLRFRCQLRGAVQSRRNAPPARHSEAQLPEAEAVLGGAVRRCQGGDYRPTGKARRLVSRQLSFDIDEASHYSPQARQRVGGMRIVRQSAFAVEQVELPAWSSPMPAIALIASSAAKLPTVAVSAPSTPSSAQLSQSSASNASPTKQR